MHEPAPSPMHTEHVDLLIIGWGKGGKTLAGQVGRTGRRVAVVEQSDLMVGGSCSNIACVPTKALIHDAESRRDVTTTRNPGSTPPSLVATRSRARCAPGTIPYSPQWTPCCWSRAPRGSPGRARWWSRASTTRLGGRIHDSESIQHVSPLPRRLTVIGGGYVGLEFACATSPISIFPGGSCHEWVTRPTRERSHSNSPGRVTTIP